MKFEFETIGVIHSPFKEKFGIPRQPGLVSQVQATLELVPPFNRPKAVSGLEGYSHIWIQFVFHQNINRDWQPTVRPPRLGGNKRVGVFASRSPFRPNPIGLSVVALDDIRCDSGKVELLISGVDLMEGTPVLDIKPYIPYVESLPEARSGFAPSAPAPKLVVHLTPPAEKQLESMLDPSKLRKLIEAVLETDPRPAYVGASRPDKVYGIRLYDWDVRWRVRDLTAEVLELVEAQLKPGKP
ncbi:MAG: tRNA (N6-threonylcarbamoyladenosine(37)-N6)-methyltransferase TrmO [Gammaproteobacteria bacterium]|nr:tRNA (N6-threonylcarbamoyladenosine(37)-N6)-methyltransferase TrmO [Gammaproteobacteria bacterium]